MVDFDIAPVKPSIIMCAGVGGGGGNAVKHMFKLGMADVTFVICNTDRQALEDSPVPIKIRLGDKLTGGLGAGNKPERGRQAALESLEQIKTVFAENDTRMLFVTAGMGGGTGTGAAPVIAQAAREMGILTVAIVSIPFKTEGRKRVQQALEGIEEISKHVDSLLVVDNESINEIYGDLTLTDAFGKADDILATAAKSIADIITSHFKINVDFEDVKTVMQNSGVALMGSAQGQGENRALDVATKAMSSPLLNQKDISGAQNVLLNITSGTREVTLRETYDITQYIQQRAGNNNTTDLIWGAGQDESLGDDIRVTVIATGFKMDSIPALRERYGSSLTSDQVAPTTPTADAREIVNLDEPEKPVQPVQHIDSDFSVVMRAETATTPPDNDWSTPTAGGVWQKQNNFTTPASPTAHDRLAQQEVVTPFLGEAADPLAGERFSQNFNNSHEGNSRPDDGLASDSGKHGLEPIALQNSTPPTQQSLSQARAYATLQGPEQRFEASETRQRLTQEGDPLTTNLAEEALSEPAWKRRGVQLETANNATNKGQRETLKTDRTSEKVVLSPDLFE